MKHIRLAGCRNRRYQSLRCQGRDLKARGRWYPVSASSPWSCINQVSSSSGLSPESLDNSCIWNLNSTLPMTMSVSVSPRDHSRRSHPPNAQTLGQGPNTPNRWHDDDDDTLFTARAKNLGWGQIQKIHFPTKTPNACRKRYERAIARRHGSKWDHEKLEKLRTHYRDLREPIWKPLADAIGERWEDVEKVCFDTGLKPLLSTNRATGVGRKPGTTPDRIGEMESATPTSRTAIKALLNTNPVL